MRHKILWSVIFLFLYLGVCLNVHATPPSKIDLKYDRDNGKLAVDIAHISDNANKHYISKIFLQVNQDAVQKFYYRRQVMPNKFEVEFPLELKPGDVVTVKAQCSQGGALEVSLKIEEDTENISSDMPVKSAIQKPKQTQNQSY